MKIGELARSTRTTVKTIRYYESVGLIRAATRTDSGYRLYGPDDAERLGFIRKAKRLGMSLEEIRGVLQLHYLKEPTCVHVRSLLDEKISRIDLALKELREFRGELAALRDASEGLQDCCPAGGNVCGIVERSEITLDQASVTWLGSHWPR